MKSKILVAILLIAVCCPIFAIHQTYYYDVSALSFRSITNESGTFEQIVWPNSYCDMYEIGKPELPIFHHNIKLSETTAVDSVKIVLAQGISGTLSAPVLPVQRPIPTGVSSNQEFSSANTSINSSKLPAVFNKVKFKPGTINLDYGGGKFDNATEFLAQQDVTNLIFDKFNRSEDHNRDVIKKVRQNGGADTATCSNVLNVIKERDIRVNEVIKNIRSMLKLGGTAYFTVYEGTGAGDSRETKAGYQLNKKTADYVEEIAEIFGNNNVSRKGSVIVARK